MNSITNNSNSLNNKTKESLVGYFEKNPADGLINPGLINPNDIGSSNPISVSGNTLSWSGDGWFEVQDSSTHQTIHEGGGDGSVTLKPGVYTAINHHTGQRYEGIQVGGGENATLGEQLASTLTSTESLSVELQGLGELQPITAPTSIDTVDGSQFAGLPSVFTVTIVPQNPNGSNTFSVSGDTISWSDDGWFEIQDSTTHQTIHEGGNSVTLEPGEYTAINHHTGERFEGIQVLNSTSLLVDGVSPSEFQTLLFGEPSKSMSEISTRELVIPHDTHEGHEPYSIDEDGTITIVIGSSLFLHDIITITPDADLETVVEAVQIGAAAGGVSGLSSGGLLGALGGAIVWGLAGLGLTAEVSFNTHLPHWLSNLIGVAEPRPEQPLPPELETPPLTPGTPDDKPTQNPHPPVTPAPTQNPHPPVTVEPTQNPHPPSPDTNDGPPEISTPDEPDNTPTQNPHPPAPPVTVEPTQNPHPPSPDTNDGPSDPNDDFNQSSPSTPDNTPTSNPHAP